MFDAAQTAAATRCIVRTWQMRVQFCTRSEIFPQMRSGFFDSDRMKRIDWTRKAIVLPSRANAQKGNCMKTQQKLASTLLGLALGATMSLTATAQSGGDSGSGGQGGGMTANSNSSFTGWMTDHSTKNKGRVSRDAYMAEASRRWDAMDTTKQGLTTDQIGRMYGYPSTLGGPTPSTANEKKGITR